MRIVMSEALRFDGPLRVGSHHYASSFMRAGHPVFWLSHSYHVVGLVRGLLGSQRDAHAVQCWRTDPTAIGPGSWSHHPITALPLRDRPFFRSRWVYENSLRAALKPLRPLLRRCGFDNPELLWLSQAPGSLAAVRSIRADRIVYRLSDFYAGFPGVPAAVRAAEAELIERADLVLVTSRALLDSLPASARHKAVELPNGVDLEHFARPALPAPVPEDLAPIPAPRAVYVGSIREWLDVGLLAEAAAAAHDVSFVFIGPIERDVGPLQRLENVHFLGPRRYQDLPPYLHHADVGLIPFVQTALTAAANPVKLYEYCAAGLPVVATPLPELERIDAPARLANTGAAFADAIRAALRGTAERTDPETFARGNTWQARQAALLDALGWLSPR